MIKEIIQFRDELNRRNKDHREAMAFWNANEIDEMIRELDKLVWKSKVKERKRRNKIFKNRMKLIDLLNEKSAKTKVSRMQ